MASTSTPGTPVRARTVTATAVTVLLACLGATASLFGRWAGTDRGGAIALAATIVVFAFAGGVLTLARPDNRVGWLMLVGAAIWGAGQGLYDVAWRGIVAAPGTVPGADWYTVAGAGLRAVGWPLLALAVPAAFPDGRLPGPRWRWLGWTVASAIAVTAVGTALAADVESTELRAAGWHNPLPEPAVLARVGDALAGLGLLATVISLGGVVAAVIVRARRGSGPMRRQLLLFGCAVALPVIIVPTAFVGGLPSWIFAVAVAPIPIAVAVAIFTGGMFDLATLANRSLVWAALTAVVVGIYALVVAGTGALLGGTDKPIVTWLAVAAVAASFAPLRTTLQGAVNRVTYGRWREPYDVLAELGQRVEAAADTDRLAGEVVAELGTTLGLRAVAVRDATGQLVAGSVGAEPDAVGGESMALVAYGRTVGSLHFDQPATPLRAADHRLLDDLAAQVGALLHARALTRDLRGARDRLVRAREEERRRLRRDLHDGVGPALAGMMLKVDTALLRMGSPPPAAREVLEALRSDIQATVGEVRRLVEGLRPPAVDELGLAQALHQAVHRLGADAGLTVEVEIAGLAPLPAAVEVAAYRIVAEAVTNVVRHAGATHCHVSVGLRDGDVVAVVHDDGRGVSGRDHTRTGHGLSTMRERAEELGGTLSVVDGGGTTVTAVLPMEMA